MLTPSCGPGLKVEGHGSTWSARSFPIGSSSGCEGHGPILLWAVLPEVSTLRLSVAAGLQVGAAGQWDALLRLEMVDRPEGASDRRK